MAFTGKGKSSEKKNGKVEKSEKEKPLETSVKDKLSDDEESSFYENVDLAR